MLTEETRNKIMELQQRYPCPRSALIPALHLAQAELGYLPQEVQQEVAVLFNIALNEVNAIVTFYDMFFEAPRGKHLLHVCKNVSCMLQGADQLMEQICARLQIAPGETSSNSQFTLIPCECLGACDRAPVMLFDETVHGPVHSAELDQLLPPACGKEQNG